MIFLKKTIFRRFDQPSNVWGLAQAVLWPLFNESASSFDDNTYERIDNLLARMLSERKRGRPPAAKVVKFFRRELDRQGGGACVAEYQRKGGFLQHLRAERISWNY